MAGSSFGCRPRALMATSLPRWAGGGEGGGGEGGPVARRGAAAETGAAGPGRQIRVDLRRLDALMKQVGELVVAKNRLSALSVGASDPALVELSERIARLG